MGKLLLFQRTWVWSQHPYGSSQPFLTPVPGDLTPSFGLSHQVHMYYTDIHEGKTPIYIKQANIKARCHTALSHMMSKRQEYKDLPKNTAKAE